HREAAGVLVVRVDRYDVREAIVVDVRDGDITDVGAAGAGADGVEPAVLVVLQDGDGGPRAAAVVGAEVRQDGVREAVLVKVGDRHAPVVVQAVDRERVLDVEQRRGDPVFKLLTPKLEEMSRPATARGWGWDAVAR